MNFCFIMRGIPGSGKSTVAEKILRSSLGDGPGGFLIRGRIHSTDSYFYNEYSEYKFDPSRLGEFHAANLQAFKESLAKGLPVVICDNTNTQRWEYQKYLDAAEEAGYIVSIVTLPHPPVEVAAERNSHGVPAEVIQRMLDRWES